MADSMGAPEHLEADTSRRIRTGEIGGGTWMAHPGLAPWMDDRYVLGEDSGEPRTLVGRAIEAAGSLA